MTPIVLQWTPVHTGIMENGVPDQLSKEGRKKEETPSNLSYKEAKTLFRNKKKSNFHGRTRGYNQDQDAHCQLA